MVTSANSLPGPLDDVIVVEIDNWMASPSAGAIMADMGATVIKIEPLTGDPMRDMGRPVKLPDDRKHYDYQFDVDNRGKHSIAIALDTHEGQQLVREIVATAQVFMCNLLTRRQEAFGLDPASLLAVNPSLVHATLTGYGTTGPEAWRPGYDVTAFFSRSGLYDAMREGEDGIPPFARPAQGDQTTGMAFFGAIMAALRLAEKSGKGQIIETSLFETAVWTEAIDLSVAAVDKAPLRQRSRENLVVATMNRYPCSDGSWIVINGPQEKDWESWCAALGKLEWLTDERFDSLRSRFRNMPELVRLTDEVTRTKSREEWGEILDAHSIVWGPVQALHEVVVDPQAEAIDLFPTLTSPEIGDYQSIRIPMRSTTANVNPRGPAPKLGEHTEDLLQQLGLSVDEINALVEQKIVRRHG